MIFRKLKMDDEGKFLGNLIPTTYNNGQNILGG